MQVVCVGGKRIVRKCKGGTSLKSQMFKGQFKHAKRIDTKDATNTRLYFKCSNSGHNDKRMP